MSHTEKLSMEAGSEPVLLADPLLVFAGLASLVFLPTPTSLPCPDLGGGVNLPWGQELELHLVGDAAIALSVLEGQ